MCRTNLPLGVAEDDSLCDGEGVVEVTERVKLPLLLLHCHEELLDALQSQLITAGRGGGRGEGGGGRGERGGERGEERRGGRGERGGGRGEGRGEGGERGEEGGEGRGERGGGRGEGGERGEEGGEGRCTRSHLRTPVAEDSLTV